MEQQGDVFVRDYRRVGALELEVGYFLGDDEANNLVEGDFVEDDH